MEQYWHVSPLATYQWNLSAEQRAKQEHKVYSLLVQSERGTSAE